MSKSYAKTCLKSGSKFTKKDGKRKGRQSYKCKRCNYVWISKSRHKKVFIEAMYQGFSYHKQTYKELGIKYGLSISSVQKYLDEYISSHLNIQEAQHKTKEVILLIDTTYFGSFGLILFKDKKSKDVLHYEIVDYETNQGYRRGIEQLQQQGWVIKAIVCDGRRGLLGGFGNISTQMCHFHQH